MSLNNSKVIFLPALLVSILLFTVSNLKLGIFLNNTAKVIFLPITKPVLTAKLNVHTFSAYYRHLPSINKENREQKVLISHLVWENETLKQLLKDSKTQTTLQNNFQQVLPVKISSLTGKIFATSSQSFSTVSPGMPVVSGNILLGLVTQVNGTTLDIISLEDELFPTFPLRSASGPKGVFRHNKNASQITNVPSQTPLILGDFVLTEATDLIPPNLLVGKITKLLTTPQEPIQKGEIKLYDTIQNSPDNIVIVTKP